MNPQDEVKHICGAAGFGQSIYDECPGCIEVLRIWEEEAILRVRNALDLDALQIIIAKVARVSLSDVRRVLTSLLTPGAK